MNELCRTVEEMPEIVSTILPDLEMVPEVHTSKPSWLMRRSRSRSPMKKDDSKSQQHMREPLFESKSNKVSLHLIKYIELEKTI